MKKTITPELRSVFEKLQDDVIEISYTWQIIRNLFMNQETIAVLNATAPNFFLVSQRAFADSLLLSITRITDHARSGGQDNLVITRLLDLIDQTQYPALFVKLKERIEDAITRSKPFRTHRNKRLGHADLGLRMKYVQLELPSISIDDIEQTITSLQDSVNTFAQYFLESETVFKIAEGGGTKALITYLTKGLDAFEMEKKEMLTKA